MRYILGFIILIIIVILTKLFIYDKFFIPRKKTMPLPVVEITTVKSTIIQEYVSANGVIKPRLSVDIVSDTPGKIIQILFKPGQSVHAGDILLILDHAELSAEIEEAQAKYLYQKNNFNRFLILSKQGIIAKDNLDNLKSQLDQQAAIIHRLTAELDKRIIRAPFRGVLGISDISLGQYIETGEKIVNCRNDESVMLDLTIPSEYLQKIQIGQSVAIRSMDNRCGRVEAIDTRTDPQSHGITIRAELDHCNFNEISGMLVSAFIFTAEQLYLTVPATSLNYSIQGNSLFIVHDDKVKQIPVDVELDHDTALIKKGNVEKNDWIVSQGQEKLYDGEKIKSHVRK